jgi:type II secretory ATPase GspE/PulE/Tfp pilus assembly ATPase PilB-like protein
MNTNQTFLTPWQQLTKSQITDKEALKLLITPQRKINLELLDQSLTKRFFSQFKDKNKIPHVIPLLLWQGHYYLGYPRTLKKEEQEYLKYSLNTQLKLIKIEPQSYLTWYHQQNTQKQLSDQGFINPLTGEIDPENITETTQFSLAQAQDQIEKIKTIIASALRNRASDIHLEPTIEGLRVRFRIDGILRHITTIKPEFSRKIIVALKAMCDLDIANSRIPQDGRLGEKYISGKESANLDLRVNTLPCVSGLKGEMSEKAVLRLLRQNNSFQTIADLGFSEKTRQIYETWLSQPQGIIIFTGPTGSGKTSTLYTSLQAIANESINVITVENPVEYLLPGITQTQVNEAAGMTFAAGLKAILRQDPDIVMLGEIRDHETAETAIRAALTGHLVLTTLHTNDAIGAIPRLKDLSLDTGLIADALLGVVAQRLVRKNCPNCSESYHPRAEDLELLGLAIEDAHITNWKKGKGCKKCFNSGYLGREAVVELLNVDDTVRQIIYEGSLHELKHYLHNIEYDCFRVSAIEKVTKGITTIEEIKRVLPYSVLRQPVTSIPRNLRLKVVNQ